ncbi:hypothetical protein [Bacillus safensis]|uniref:hypothetical protein n=1 Tax=Bacillus safensis TaxID=561879 RepID=UPI000DAD43FF|nr:hypothetical protein [Bacillus safensis]
MNNPVIFSNHCAFCKKREAERLCDYITDYHRTPIFFRDYKMFKESIESGHDSSCDLPLCKMCSNHINGADLCPYHYDLYKQAKDIPQHLKKYQHRERKRLIEGAKLNES